MTGRELADELAKAAEAILRREGLATGRVVVGIAVWEDAHSIELAAPEDGGIECGGLHPAATACVPMPRASCRAEALCRVALGFSDTAEAVSKSADRARDGATTPELSIVPMKGKH